MHEKYLFLLQGTAFFLLATSSIISLRIDDFSGWAINLILALMVISAGNLS